MKYLDAAGVRQFKEYNDSKYIVTEDVASLTAGSLEFYTKAEIDEMLEDIESGNVTESDPVFTASAASGITSGDISNWNSKTSNTGTITGITMNGSSKGTSGVVDLGTVITSETALSKGTASGSGNVVTDISVSNHQITLTKGVTVPVGTSANSGKIPMINSSGGWDYVTPSAIYSGSGTPNNNNGNNGDIYLQM